MNTQDMKGGYTTGSCATAGMKASLLALLEGEVVNQVQVLNPRGEMITVPIKDVVVISPTEARATVVKDGGDDPDITHGHDVVTTVCLGGDVGLRFHAGIGVGTVTKPGLSIPVGEPAINKGPRTMMGYVYDDLASGKGVDVTVSVPDGEMLAKKTLNPTLGVVGGISIIGTTGIVKPMSEEGFKNSLVPQLEVMHANGVKTAILVPGRIGQELSEKLFGVTPDKMAETSNFIGFMLEQAVRIGFKRILIIGHIGKVIKLASGSFHTHNRMSDGRMETIVAFAALEGASQAVCEELYACQTTEAVMPILEREGLTGVYQRVVDRASLRCERYIGGEARVGIIITTLSGEILAVDKTAQEIGELEHWHIPCI